MDTKQVIEFEAQKKSGKKTLFLLSATLFSFSLIFIIILVIGGAFILVAKTPDEKDNTYTEEFYIDVKQDETILNERVIVDYDNQVEFVINRDQDTGHIVNMMAMDFNQGYEFMYHTESDECYISDMGNDIHEFQNDLAILRNGGEMQNMPTTYYSVGDFLLNATMIPEEFNPFCSLRNTFWLEPETRERRQIAGRSHCCCCCCRCRCKKKRESSSEDDSDSESR